MRKKNHTGNVEHMLAGISMGALFGLFIGIYAADGNAKAGVERLNDAWDRCEYVVPKDQIEDSPSEWRDIEPTPSGNSWCVRTK